MYRYLLVHTSAYTLPKYKQIKKLYQDNIKEAHKRLLRFKTKFVKQNNLTTEPIFYVNLIGLDKTVKYTFTSVNNSTFKTIFKKIDAMPLGHLRPSKTKKRGVGLSLYSDYNKKKTLKGTGFKDEATAKRTLKLISKRDLTYQKQVVNTMYNRAKFHPNQTPNMRKAMRVFNTWLSKNKT